VGFSILMILMAGVTHIIQMSSEMLFNTKDMEQEQNSFLEQFYRTNHGTLSTTKLSSVTVYLEETDATGENKLTGGAKLTLDHAVPEKVSDTTTGITVYQMDYQ
jgi:hypothetical protein